MSLVGEQRYRTLTGDTTSTPAAVASALADAQDLIEGLLRRPLESAVRTETLPIYRDGRIYPSATPVTVAPAGYTIDGSGLVGSTPGLGSGLWGPVPNLIGTTSVAVTYTGGWTEATVPFRLARGIAQAAHDQLHQDTTVPAGAISVRQGDASVTFATPTGSAGLLSSTAWSSVKGYRRRDAA